MEITLCDKKLTGDILTHKLKEGHEVESLVSHWLENKDYNTSVFVCFILYTKFNYKDEIQTILVSHSWDDIVDHYQYHCCQWYDKTPKNIRLGIYEFDTYEEAFKYCIDLKEGL